MIDVRTGRIAAAAMLLAVSGCTSGGATADAIRHGDELVAQKRFAEAAESYRVAVEARPGEAALRVKLGDAYSLAGDSVRAADLLPDNVDVQLRAAAAMLEQGRFPDVSDRMGVLLRKEPSNVPALILHANATARLRNSTAALYSLADRVGDPDRFAAARGELRPPVSSSDDLKAEQEFRKALAAKPDEADAQLALANFLWATGRPDESELTLRAFADQQPTHAAANHALGSYYLSRSRTDDALPYLKNAAAAPRELGRGARFTLIDHYLATAREDEAAAQLALMLTDADDTTGEASLRLAGIDARAGRPADAVRRIDALLARVPNKASALVLKAQVLAAMGNPDQRYAQAAVDADPKSGEAHLLLGGILLAAHDVDGALEQYQEAAKLNPNSLDANLALARVQLTMGKLPEAQLRARDAVRIGPESREASLLLVKVLAQQQNYQAAEAALAPLQARLPNDPEVAIQAGTLLAARGNTVAARAAFVRALQTQPTSLDALSGLVAIELATRPSPDTQQKVEAALQARPRDPGVLYLAWQLYNAENDAPRAEAVLRRAFEIDRSNSKVGQALAAHLTRTGRIDDAVGVLRQALESRPRAIDLRTSLALLLDDAGRTKEAQPLYEQIVDEDPGAALVALRLGNLYLSNPDKLPVVLDLAVAAKRGLPNDPAANDLLGRVYTMKGLTSLALPPLRDAVAAAPENASYRLHLGAAYERAGNLSQARAEYAKALEMDSALPGADQARRLLRGAPRR